MDASAVLMQRLGDRAKKNPVMQMGQSFLNGNMQQGMQDMAQSRIGPQMQFAQTMFNPESTMGDRVGGYFDMVDQISQRRRGMQPNQAMPSMANPMVQPNQQGVSAMLNTNDLPYGQGLPGGLLPYMSRMG
jgi:putative hemolysin